jgi:hypothetical protein
MKVIARDEFFDSASSLVQTNRAIRTLRLH